MADPTKLNTCSRTDTSNFPSARYPYAFETFGNNGTTPRNSSATSSANHSLDDLTNTVPNAVTVYADLKLSGSGSSFTGSDHYPVVGDYNVVPTPPFAPVLIAQGFVTNGYFQLHLSSTPNTGFEIQAPTDLTSFGSGHTDANGVLIFQDMNAANFPRRFYRAYWPLP
jgi:hypothetical protein